MARLLGFLLLLLCSGEILAAGLANPMRPVHYSGGNPNPAAKNVVADNPSARWELTAVLISAARSVAVVNGKPLQLGETLEGFELVEIMPEKVRLKRKDQITAEAS